MFGCSWVDSPWWYGTVFIASWASNRSQMTSNCGKNKKVAHEAIAECVTDVLTTFWRPLGTDARQHGIYLFYTIKKRTTSAFYFKIFLNYSKAGLCLLWQTRKKAIWRNLLSIQNEAIPLVAMHNNELWLVKKNHATVKLDSNAFSCNENLQQKQNWTAKATNVKKNCWKNQLSFCHQSSLVGRKAWMFPWILLELKEYARKTCGCGQHWTSFDLSFEWKEGYRRWKFVSFVVSDSQISLT